MNRCLNSLFAYCNGTPDIITDGISIKYIDLAGKEQIKEQFYNQCRLCPETCGHMTTQTQLPILKDSHLT